MSESNREHLDAYLDGSLGKSERSAFESLLERNPELRREVELQRRIDAALRGELNPPSDERAADLLESALAATPSTLHPPRRPLPLRLPRVAIAAAFLIAATGGILYLTRGWRDPNRRPLRIVNVDSAYQRELKEGFDPNRLCPIGQPLAAAIWHRTGQGLLIPTAAELTQRGIQVLGFTRAHSVAWGALVLMLRIDEKPVLVFICRPSEEKPQSIPTGGKLNIFRRTIGGALLVEVSPLPSARALPEFFDPHMPTEWYDVAW